LKKEEASRQTIARSGGAQESQLNTILKDVASVRESVDERFALVQKPVAEISDIGQIRETISKELSSVVQDRPKVIVQREIVKAIREIMTRTVQQQVSEVVCREVGSVVQHEVKSIVDEDVAAIIQQQVTSIVKRASHYYHSGAGYGNPRKAAVHHSAVEPERNVCRHRARSARQPPQ
jgi:hypothetical protein